MRILCTGHKGFIGSHLVPALEQAGHTVYGLDLKDNQDILLSRLPEVDAVIHLAAQADVMTSVEDPVADAQTNIIGTIRLAKEYQDTRFIFASSGGTIQETIESPYGMSKFCGEKYIELLCRDYVILRFPNVFGERGHSVIEKFLSGPVTIFGDGTATRQYVHVSDIVRGIIQSLTWPKGLYKLGNGKNISVLELAQTTGKPIAYAPKRKGELDHTPLENTTPNWQPQIDVIKYIKDAKN